MIWPEDPGSSRETDAVHCFPTRLAASPTAILCRYATVISPTFGGCSPSSTHCCHAASLLFGHGAYAFRCPLEERKLLHWIPYAGAGTRGVISPSAARLNFGASTCLRYRLPSPRRRPARLRNGFGSSSLRWKRIRESGGCFIISGEHPAYSCLEWNGSPYTVAEPYLTEGPREHGSWKGVPIVIQRRALSTFVGQIIQAGLQIEALVETPLWEAAVKETHADPARWYSVARARMMPTMFIIKARKSAGNVRELRTTMRETP